MRRVRLYRVSSVVIRQRDLAEADRIVTLYTRERGKLSAVAKGVRRARSKLAGGLQLFSLAQVQLAAGRSLQVATQVQPADTFYHLREDMWRYAHACYVAELLDSLVDEEAPDRPLFELLVATLRGLDAGGDPPTLLHGFELRLLSRLGYGPELSVCVICGGDVDAGRAGFSASQGGVVCARCRAGRGAVALAPTALRAMRDLVALPPEEVITRRLSSSARRELQPIMRAFVDYRLARPLRSAEFLAL